MAWQFTIRDLLWLTFATAVASLILFRYPGLLPAAVPASLLLALYAYHRRGPSFLLVLFVFFSLAGTLILLFGAGH